MSIMQKDFFISNRAALREKVGDDPIIVSAYTLLQRSGDAAFKFEQEANFWYLTGIDSADWKLVIEGERSWLIAPDVDEVHQIFDGSIAADEALQTSGVDMVLNFSEGEKLMADLASKYQKVFTIGDDPRKGHYDFALNPGPVQLLETLQAIFATVNDCRSELAKLRAIKKPEEIEQMKAAIALTVEAFDKVKENMQSYTSEYEIEADFSYAFRKNGAKGHAYDPIVAMGKNACTLHYVKNEDDLEAGQFVLLDIGARYNGYAADITRTYAFGKMSDRHVVVHRAVETAHHEIIALLQPGVNVKEYFHKVDEIMIATLHELGLLKEKSDYRKYFPHSISHGLGIDVHDSLGGPEVFQPGMVLTVEPGIYIPEEGIGVRIEDDILITEAGNENLSHKLSTSL